MSWFWPKKIVVVHRIEGLDKLVEAIRYSARVRAGLVSPKRADEPAPIPHVQHPKEERLRDWLAAQAWDANKISHFAALIDVFVGKRPESGQWTRSAAIRAMLDEEAPLGV